MTWRQRPQIQKADLESEQFRQSSLERTALTGVDDKASLTDSRERRPWTRACGRTSQARELKKKAPPEASSSQSMRTCLRREKPVDHAAQPQAQRRELHHEARLQPHSGPRQERTMSGKATSQASATTTALDPTISTLIARRGIVVLAKQPADHGQWRARKQHVEQWTEENTRVSTWMRGAREKRRQRVDRS